MSQQREPVAIGLDLRPIPFEMGDGRLFHLDADPSSKAEWYVLLGAVKALAEVDTIKAKDFNAEDAMRRQTELRKAFLPLLAEDEGDAWLEANYGGMPLQTLFAKYVEALSGLPTKP